MHVSSTTWMAIIWVMASYDIHFKQKRTTFIFMVVPSKKSLPDINHLVKENNHFAFSIRFNFSLEFGTWSLQGLYIVRPLYSSSFFLLSNLTVLYWYNMYLQQILLRSIIRVSFKAGHERMYPKNNSGKSVFDRKNFLSALIAWYMCLIVCFVC